MFAEKLKYIMLAQGVKSSALAKAIRQDPASISRWRSGERTPSVESGVIDDIAAYFVKRAAGARQREWLNTLLCLEHQWDENFVKVQLAVWFVDGEPVSGLMPQAQEDYSGACFMGFSGLKASLNLLAEQVKRYSVPAKLCVYIASGKSSLLSSPIALEAFERLYDISKTATPVIIETCRDTSIYGALEFLSPLIREGKLELLSFPSSERRFCYNATFHAENMGMAMAIEPSGASMEALVSMFIPSSSFVDTLGNVLLKLKKEAKPVLTFEDISTYDYAALFQYNGLISATHRTVSSLNALLAHCEPLLQQSKANAIRSIISVHALEQLPEDGVRALRHLVANYANFEVALDRQAHSPADALIKNDELLLIRFDAKYGYSKNWPLIYEFLRNFDGHWYDSENINGRDNILAAIQIRLSRLEETK